MSGTAGFGQSDGAVEQARAGVERAEAGEAGAVEQVSQAQGRDRAGVEAVEQEAADGPAGRGVSR